jgi:hypothetical protein
VQLDQHKEEEDQRYAEREIARRRAYITRNGNDRNYNALRHEGITFHYRAQLYASFPFLMDVSGLEREELSFTEAEWAQRRRAGRWRAGDEPYLKYIPR